MCSSFNSEIIELNGEKFAGTINLWYIRKLHKNTQNYETKYIQIRYAPSGNTSSRNISNSAARRWNGWWHGRRNERWSSS